MNKTSTTTLVMVMMLSSPAIGAVDYEIVGPNVGIGQVFEDRERIVVEFGTVPPGRIDVSSDKGEPVPATRTGRFLVISQPPESMFLTVGKQTVQLASTEALAREKRQRQLADAVRDQQEAARQDAADARLAARQARASADMAIQEANQAQERAAIARAQEQAASKHRLEQATLDAASQIAPDAIPTDHCVWKLDPAQRYLSTAIAAWSEQAGYQQPFWETDDPVIERTATFCGTFFDAVHAALSSFAQSKTPIRMVFHALNNQPQFISGGR